MAGEINFGLLDTRAPERAANAFYEGQQRQQRNALMSAQLHGVQRQNKLADLAMSDDEARRDAYRNSGGDLNKVLSTLEINGQGDAAMKLRGQMSAQQKDKIAQAVEMAKLLKTHASSVFANPTPETAAMAITQYGQQTGQDVSQQMQLLQSFGGDPAKIKQWAAGHAMEADKAANLQLSQDKFGYQQRNDAENRGVTLRGQNISAGNAAASRDQSERHFQVTSGQGKAPAGYRNTADGNMEPIPGGPADLKQSKESSQKTGDAKDVLTLLDEVDTLLPNATGSYLGAAVDQGARAFGASTAGSVATAQLKTLQGGLISKMPKMSGPQSDKDVQLYREMAGQVGDETLPIKSRQAASAMIRRLNEKYAGMPAGSIKSPTNGAYSDAEKEARYQAYKASQGK